MHVSDDADALHGHDTLYGLLLGGVEVGGEVGEVGLGGELPDEGDKVLLHVETVDRIRLAVGVVLLDVLVKVVLGRSQEVGKIHPLPVWRQGRVTFLAVILKLVIVVVVADLVVSLLYDVVDLVDKELEQLGQERHLGPLLIPPGAPCHSGLGVDLITPDHDLVQSVVVAANSVLQDLRQGCGAHL